MAFTSGSFIKYIYDYNVMKPAYLCESPLDSGNYSTCSSDQICDNREKGIKVNYVINWDDSESLDNWVEKLDLICKIFLL